MSTKTVLPHEPLEQIPMDRLWATLEAIPHVLSIIQSHVRPTLVPSDRQRLVGELELLGRCFKSTADELRKGVGN